MTEAPEKAGLIRHALGSGLQGLLPGQNHKDAIASWRSTTWMTDVDDPAAASCEIDCGDIDTFVDSPPFVVRDDSSLTAPTALPELGLYRVQVHSGGASAISQLMLAIDLRELADADAANEAEAEADDLEQWR